MNNKMTIPIITGDTKFYMDASKITLGELITLREKLKGFSNISVVAIDKIIYEHHIDSSVYNSFQNKFSRENRKQKERKRNKINKVTRRR